MQIELIAFGKLKTPGIRTAVDYFYKGIRRWAKISELEILERMNDKPASKSTLPDSISRSHSLLVVCDPEGKKLNSSQLSHWLDHQAFGVGKKTSFLVGPSQGFSKDIRESANLTLSLSPMITSHEIARLFLAEQIYRSISILKNHPYHKEEA